MKLTFCILTFVFNVTLSATGQTDADIHDFFSWRTSHKYHDNQVKIKRVRDTIIQWDSTDFSFLRLDTTDLYERVRYRRLDSILTPTNKQFILQQINQLKTKLTWDKKIFNGQKLVKEKPLNEIHKGTDYWEFSVPLFTADKKFCFIKETYVCGQLCIDWFALLYQRTADGKWKLFMTIWSMSS